MRTWSYFSRHMLHLLNHTIYPQQKEQWHIQHTFLFSCSSNSWYELAWIDIFSLSDSCQHSTVSGGVGKHFKTTRATQCAWSPAGLPWQTQAPKQRSDTAICKHFQKSIHLLRSEVSWCDQTWVDLQLHRSTCLASWISTQKRTISEVRVHAGAKFGHLDMLDAIYRQMQILHKVLEIVWSPW